MSLMQEYEDIRNFLGHKKYDAMCKYIEIFGNYESYHKTNIANYGLYRREFHALKEAYKIIKWIKTGQA